MSEVRLYIVKFLVILLPRGCYRILCWHTINEKCLGRVLDETCQSQESFLTRVSFNKV